MPETTNVKALERALLLLEALIDSGAPLGVNELAKRSEISPATAFRLMQTLKNHGFVRQNGEDKYLPGRRMTFVAAERSLHTTLRDIALLEMERLTAVENEAMNLVVREGNRCYILAQSRTNRFVDYVPPIGTELPFHASACGKLLLAHLPTEYRSELIATLKLTKMTERTLTDPDALIRELELILERGYSLDAHESQAEGFCIAVPIPSAGGEPIAALSFSGFIGRRTDDEIDRCVGLLRGAAKRISDALLGFET